MGRVREQATGYTYWEFSEKQFWCECCQRLTGDLEHVVFEESEYTSTHGYDVISAYCKTGGGFLGRPEARDTISQEDLDYVKKSLGVMDG